MKIQSLNYDICQMQRKTDKPKIVEISMGRMRGGKST